ncbi:MAG: hypothetical protein NTW10_07880 [Bacteroidetes bacterium]|nr:hypothetical protein [Bacteroidota bacterium]
MRKYLLIPLLFFAFLSGCKKETVHLVIPDDFSVYVQEFENEARLRGKHIDIEGQGLKIEYADFTGQVYVALCHYEENPVRIQVDYAFWHNQADTSKEMVFFHELAHGFLGIHEHRNDTFLHMLNHIPWKIPDTGNITWMNSSLTRLKYLPGPIGLRYLN